MHRSGISGGGMRGDGCDGPTEVRQRLGGDLRVAAEPNRNDAKMTIREAKS